MNRYFYEGPVVEFGRVISNCWRASTCACSEKKARSNLAYQFKKQNSRLCNSAHITLPGKLITR